ncbi:polyketide antibiotic transporter [Microbacterium hominis]|uniref:polyketide antibiotic transporter n=1 Tax=Microbacterium hominis TaxID=162426 RepID=UPI001F059C6D|nr:polyketide antibiotic transporter [Microbacterium hominis]
MTTLAPLLRQRLRRDAVQLGVWIGGTAALAAAGYPGVRGSYGDEQERVALLATVMANPVILLFRGLPSGAGEAQMVAFLLLPWLLLLGALMSSFLAVRHSRGDEEEGRLDLVAATPAGRSVPLAATVVHGAVAAAVLGVVVSAVFVASGAPALGSALVGAACLVVALVFLGVGLAAAELLPTARGANSLSVWVLLGCFVVAGVGNALGTPSDDLTRMTSSGLAWASPFGWAENVRPFDADDPRPLILGAVVAAVLIGAAAALHAHRDLGAAFLPERRGRAHARPALASHLALVARQSLPSVIGWTAAGVLVGVLSTSLGSVADRIGDDNPAVTAVLQALGGAGADLARGLVVVFFVMLGVFAACAATQTVVRARQDETRGTAELLLSSGVARRRWLGDHVVVALVAATLTLVGGVLGAAAGAQAASDGAGLVRDAAIAGGGSAGARLAVRGAGRRARRGAAATRDPDRVGPGRDRRRRGALRPPLRDERGARGRRAVRVRAGADVRRRRSPRHPAPRSRHRPRRGRRPTGDAAPRAARLRAAPDRDFLTEPQERKFFTRSARRGKGHLS